MKKLIYICSFLALVGSTVSCDRSLDEINKDTSRINVPVASALLVPIQYNMAAVGYNRANDFTFDLMQVSLDFPNEGNSLSRYYLTERTGNGYWDNSYRWLKQVDDLKKAAISEGDKNYQAISMVLNAWMYSNLTDTYGDVPFSEASQLDDKIMYPKFDRQKDIYIKLLDDLKAANSLFINNKTLTGGDLFFKADSDVNGIVNWKKFCNSLSLRLLTRILGKDGEVNVRERIQEIINNPTIYPVFQSNADGVKVDITGIFPLMPPIARPQDFTTGRAASEFFVETLKANNDPRMAMFFSQAKDPKTNANLGYLGAPSGYAFGTVFSYQPSNLNQNLAKAPLKLLVYPYAELQFILAELAFKGVIQGNAKTYYENGVKAAIEQWGAVVPANYFDNPVVAYGTGGMKKIMLQKYVALFFVDQQQWFEKRRTGFPELPNNGGLLNGGNLPQRLMYPTNTRVLNKENYQAAVQQMGGDDINVKVWWSK
ncbi:SusD/RagB family nutrient-binding outer membrane lipoprotein [Chryseobacterium indologenes]|uniref:SusD/RagB family nutrient-binding outer membrane lipoprotein n=1 Tax=Chryseobacterium TaxID=59732 RepID=UPI001629DD1B|nr:MULTISPECIES: SusD/RagB family nutrient-binding outer membrane lipoprotein [Chryseobacterium]MDM1552950.1 SusD/RagB family nutrient-binding outer membrane lipoprotein [Chryseobacterium indologenes]WET49078.1 SusD/RagB family nutrient-binding outer membrane lipoprotein [Chryseobacterium indologenes]